MARLSIGASPRSAPTTRSRTRSGNVPTPSSTAPSGSSTISRGNRRVRFPSRVIQEEEAAQEAPRAQQAAPRGRGRPRGRPRGRGASNRTPTRPPPDPITPLPSSPVSEAIGQSQGVESTVQDDDTDFVVEVGLKVIANSSTAMEKPLADTTRSALDLSPIESAVEKAIATVAKDDEFRLVRRLCSIKTQRGAARKNVDIDDFGVESATMIDTALSKLWRLHHAPLALTFEIKLEIDRGKKRKVSEIVIAEDESSDPSRRRIRTDDLREQSAARIQSIQETGDIQRQITYRWQCIDANCTNQHQFCYIDPASKEHFAINYAQQERWASACHSGDATVTRPPQGLLSFFREQQGPVTRQARRSTKTITANDHRNMLDSLMELQQRHIESTMQQTIMDQIERQQRRDERRELYRDAVDERELHRHPLSLNSLTSFPFAAHTSRSASPSRQPPPPYATALNAPSTEDDRRQGTLSRPTTAHRDIETPFAVLSSPIDSDDDSDLIPKFFAWRLTHVDRPEARTRLETVCQIILDEDWSIDDMKTMHDVNSFVYKRAIERGIPDGTARAFKKHLKDFKTYNRELRRDAAAAALTQSGLIPA